jgi:glyoxylate carboligase
MSYAQQVAEHKLAEAVATRDPQAVWSAIAGAVESAKELEHGDSGKAWRQAVASANKRTRTLIRAGKVDQWPVGHHLR